MTSPLLSVAGSPDVNPDSWQANRARRAVASAIAKQIASQLSADKVAKVLRAQIEADKANDALRFAIHDAAKLG